MHFQKDFDPVVWGLNHTGGTKLGLNQKVSAALRHASRVNTFQEFFGNWIYKIVIYVALIIWSDENNEVWYLKL